MINSTENKREPRNNRKAEMEISLRVSLFEEGKCQGVLFSKTEEESRGKKKMLPPLRMVALKLLWLPLTFCDSEFSKVAASETHEGSLLKRQV